MLKKKGTGYFFCKKVFMGSGLTSGNAMRAKSKNLSFPVARPDPNIIPEKVACPH